MLKKSKLILLAILLERNIHYFSNLYFLSSCYGFESQNIYFREINTSHIRLSAKMF